MNKTVLRSIVAWKPSTSVALLYPEALLFTCIFWEQQKDGLFPGALPSLLMQSDELNKRLRFAPVTNHLWSRLTNGALLTSWSSSYASLAIDIKMNQELKKSHSNYIVLKRGFDDYLQDGEALKITSCGMWDGLDSSKRVQELQLVLKRAWLFLYINMLYGITDWNSTIVWCYERKVC